MVLVYDKVDCKPQVIEMTRAAYSVEVGLRCLGEVKVEDQVHSLNVNVSCQPVCKCVCVHTCTYKT